jgi:hypothetical protein
LAADEVSGLALQLVTANFVMKMMVWHFVSDS